MSNALNLRRSVIAAWPARRDGIAHSASRRAAQFSMPGDVTLAPFLAGHRLVRDGVNDIGLLRALGPKPDRCRAPELLASRDGCGEALKCN